MDLAETIWREFAVEAEEHLNLIEQVLVHDAVSGAQIAQLFRSFHSLKGLGRTLGLGGIEATAHLSENILGIVRDGGATLDQALAHCLLQAVDALKELVLHANVARGDAPPPARVIELLKDAEARLTGKGAAAAAPAPAAPEPASALDEDPEMLVFFAEALAENLPALARALDGGDREAAREAAAMIAHGADLLGFALLGENAQAFAAGLDGDVEALRPLLDDLTAQARVVAEISGADLNLAAMAAPVAAAPLERLNAALAGGPDALAEAARDAFHWASAAGRPALADLFLHMVDLCQRAGRGEVTLNAALVQWFATIIALAGQGAEHDAERAHSLTAELRQMLAAERDGGASAYAAVAGLPLPAEMVELLTPEQATDLAEAVAGGLRLYTVLVFLEQSPEIAGRFIRWLQQSCRAVTNRTVIDRLDTGFEFLLLSSLDEEEFRRQVLEMDSTGACIRQAVALTAEGGRNLIAPESRPAEPTPAQAQARPAGEPAGGHTVIRVRKESIDDLVRLIGETLLVSNSIGTETGKVPPGELAALRGALAELGPRGAGLMGVVERLGETLHAMRDLHERLDMAIQHMHDQALELRVVPLDALFTRLLRAAREMAQNQGKDVVCEAEGRDVRIDKSIVEQLAAPLTHMVRNAIDHGIETVDERAATAKPPAARFFIRAQQRGNEVCIQIGDDGKGLNDKRILATAIKRGLITAGEADFLPRAEVHRLIFLPGFSTAETISETSGRGVGMDVVLTTVSALGGRIEIDSEPGLGSTFTIHLPLSAALQTALLVGVGGQIMAVPERHLAEIAKVEAGELRAVGGQPCMELRGTMLPVFALSDLLGMGGGRKTGGAASVLVIASGPARIGLMVDQMHGRQELYMKDLHPRLAAIPGIGGASVLGDGQVVLMLDGDGLIRRARQQAAALADSVVPA